MRRIPKKDTPELLRKAQQLRAEPTPAEVALLERLSRRRLQGLKFRFQHILLGYILDFYCPEYRIAIELDGDGHDAENDALRDRTFAAWGVLTLRFPNAKPTEEIVLAIRSTVRGRQIEYIRSAAAAIADLKAIGRSADWYATRRIELQRQKCELMARQTTQLTLDMPSSVKKDVEIVKDAASMVVSNGLHVTEPLRRKA
jgi:very-short-patch-repair endonuclease